MKRSLLIPLFLCIALISSAQKEIPLYDLKMPNSKNPVESQGIIFNNEVDKIVYNVSVPTITVFLPPKEKANGTAVIICPGHLGSREYLLGKNPSEKQIILFSNQLHVGKSTPPAFLILAGDDSVVKPENSIIFYDALRKNGISAEMHIYESGEHGFLKEPPFEEWFGRCCYWLKRNGWM